MSQFASFMACQMPFRLGLPSAVRAGRDGAWAVAGRIWSNKPATTAAVIAIGLVDHIPRIDYLGWDLAVPPACSV